MQVAPPLNPNTKVKRRPIFNDGQLQGWKIYHNDGLFGWWRFRGYEWNYRPGHPLEGYDHMIKIYNFHDPDVPEEIKRAGSLGGDEDYIIVANKADESDLQMIASKLASDFYPEAIHEITYEGVPTLVYTVTHA